MARRLVLAALWLAVTPAWAQGPVGSIQTITPRTARNSHPYTDFALTGVNLFAAQSCSLEGGGAVVRLDLLRTPERGATGPRCRLHGASSTRDAVPPGTYRLRLFSNAGDIRSNEAMSITVLGPVVTGLTPAAGEHTVPTLVTLTGTGLTDAAAVKLVDSSWTEWPTGPGPRAATDTSLQFRVEGLPAGEYRVVLTTRDGGLLARSPVPFRAYAAPVK